MGILENIAPARLTSTTGEERRKISIFNNLMADMLADNWSRNCDHEFKQVRKMMDAFGDHFDNINFINFEKNQFMKGSELRDCQTGCEMLKVRGYHTLYSGIQQCGCKQFDEQLQFVNEEDKPLSCVDYCITRADGMQVRGVTDKDGKTKRIKNTQQEMAIEKAEFFASERTQPLCPKNRIPVGTMLAWIDLSDVRTTMTDVGSSVKKVTIKGGYRPLTSGELDMAKPVFRDAIDYGEVKVYKAKFWLTFGRQPDDVAMVPDGNLYCPESIFREDFSTEAPRFKIWFIHEMAHVWQTQLGLSTMLSAAGLALKGGYKEDDPTKPPIGYRYDPVKDNGKKLPDFNFEQQAEIVSHYFAAKYLTDKEQSPKLPFLESVMKNFLVKPKDKGLLPQ